MTWPDRILCGRGSVDAKGPLACFVDAVAKIGAKEGWQFVVIGAVEEERNSEGARFVTAQYRPGFCDHWWTRINQNRYALGCKGSAWANVTVKHGQAHTASGEETASEAAVEVWLKIKACVDLLNADKQKVFDKLLLHSAWHGNGFERFRAMGSTGELEFVCRWMFRQRTGMEN